MNSVLRWLGIRREELALTSLMALTYGVLLMTQYFLKPARDSMFLVALSPAQLPLVFIVTALVAAPIASFVSKTSRTTSLPKLFARTLAVLAVNLIGLRLLIEIDAGWVYFVFYTWVAVFGVLTTSQYWLLAGAVFDSGQAKRLFTLLGAVGILGAIVGGEITRWCVEGLGVATADLLIVATGLLVVTTALVGFVWRSTPEDLRRGLRKPTPSERDADAGMRRVFATIRRSHHLSLTVGIIGSAILVGTFIDYQFKTLSYEAIGDEAKLTAFLARFYSVVNVLSLALQLFATNAVVRRFGATGAIAVLPMLLCLGSLGVMIVPGLAMVVFLRGGDMALKYSLDKTGRELLFLPVSIELKRRTKLFIDLFVDRWFRGFAGLLLLLATLVFDVPTPFLSAFAVLGCGVWLLLVIRMRSQYLESFRTAIERRELDLNDVPLNLRESAAACATGPPSTTTSTTVQGGQSRAAASLQPWVNTTEPPSTRFIAKRNPYFHRVDENGLQLPYIDQVTMTIADAKLIPAKVGSGEVDLQARALNFSDYTFLKEGEKRNDSRSGSGAPRAARGSRSTRTSPSPTKRGARFSATCVSGGALAQHQPASDQPGALLRAGARVGQLGAAAEPALRPGLSVLVRVRPEAGQRAARRDGLDRARRPRYPPAAGRSAARDHRRDRRRGYRADRRAGTGARGLGSGSASSCSSSRRNARCSATGCISGETLMSVWSGLGEWRRRRRR